MEHSTSSYARTTPHSVPFARQEKTKDGNVAIIPVEKTTSSNSRTPNSVPFARQEKTNDGNVATLFHIVQT